MNSIVRDSNYYGEDFLNEGAIPGSLSSAKWTYGNEGYEQQTFLGCSIRSFNINGEFGDSSSSLSVSLTPDEYNRSDGTGLGVGDDVYHNGVRDKLVELPPGTPIFFKFSKKKSNTNDAWMPYVREVYGSDYLIETTEPDGSTVTNPVFIDSPSETIVYTTSQLGILPKDHYVDIENSDLINGLYSVVNTENKKPYKSFVFGGILQSITKNSSDSSNPSYEVNIVDPREILSNVNLILNNYSNSTFNLPNLYNVYGFLEYSPTRKLVEELESNYKYETEFRKIVDDKGNVRYVNFPEDDAFFQDFDFGYLTDCYIDESYAILLKEKLITAGSSSTGKPLVFPKTGVGLSRRSDSGIPLYRVLHGIWGLNNFFGPLPEEYSEKGFGSYINFRGFNYVVDFGGIPLNKIPPSYHLEFDQMNVLELCQELCDVINHDFYVSLIPITSHPQTRHLYLSNQAKIASGDPNIIAGLIRIDTIDRSHKPNYGSVEKYISQIKESGIEVSSDRTGFELSNVATEKFVVGAQEVNLHFFDTSEDRYKQEDEKALYEKWELPHMLQQQVIPFYGFLGNDAVSIPRGHGSYQQILLDSRAVQADGLGPYYVATEMELRAAAISYESWKDFLLQYNDLYMESLETDDITELATLQALRQEDLPEGISTTFPIDVSRHYGVTVPRSVFDTYSWKFRIEKDSQGNPIEVLYKVDEDGVPLNPCNPPFGYPLYYKRASAIGIPEAGLTGFVSSKTKVVTNLVKLKSYSEENFRKIMNSAWKALLDDPVGLSESERDFIEAIRDQIKNNNSKDKIIGLIEKHEKDLRPLMFQMDKQADRQVENAMKVYNFVKSIADNLGKKFLVKIPKRTNPFFNNIKSYADEDTLWGPFGFKPRMLTDVFNYNKLDDFNKEIYQARSVIKRESLGVIKSMLSYGLNKLEGIEDLYDEGTAKLDLSQGALRSNYDPISEKHIFNYTPEPNGGFFEFDIYKNLKKFSKRRFSSEKAVQHVLMPPDLTNFLNESNRVGPYVAFYNSQHLDLSDLPKDSFFQILIKDGRVMPDMLHKLENVLDDTMTDFPNGRHEDVLKNKTKSVAFVKCSVDNRFYMPPKIDLYSTEVFGRSVKNIHNIQPSRKVFNRETNKEETTFPIYTANYIPDEKGGFDDTVIDWYEFEGTYDKDIHAGVINTHPSDLDSDHVYALITIDGRVKANIDMSYADGLRRTEGADKLKHFLTQDVVKGVRGLDKPGVLDGSNPRRVQFDEKFLKRSDFKIPNEVKQAAALAYKHVIKSLNSDLTANINMFMPSPIHPNLVAIPLMSKDHCYGPWIASMSNPEAAMYSGVPGKTEFLKEESLAPWTYSGYDLMNEAGMMMAKFGNSISLFNENGSFTYNDLPRHNLLQSLIEGGPLITNISVSMGPEGIQTTYNMNVYSPSFGKLDKQKKDLISKISRERQKLLDERNKNKRNSLGKMQSGSYIGIEDKYSSLKSLDTFTTGLRETADILNQKQEIEYSARVETEEVISPDGKTTTREITAGSSAIVSSEKKNKTSSMYVSTASNVNSNLSSVRGTPFEGVAMDVNTFLPYVQDTQIEPFDEDTDDLFRVV